MGNSATTITRTGASNVSCPGEVLVKFGNSVSRGQRESILSNRRFTRIRRFEALDIDLVRVPPGWAVAVAAGLLRGIPGVVMAQPNYVREAVQSAPPNDQFWLEGKLWGLERIEAPAAWTAFSHGNRDVVVASLDTGVNYRHPDLSPNMWRNPLEIAGNGIDDDGNGYVDDVFGIDTKNHDGNPLDDHGHGTLTAGTIAAAGNNGVGVVGVNWTSSILACKFLGQDGTGTDAGAIECFNYLVGLKNRGVNIRVSANGWGGSRNDVAPASVLKAAVDAAGAVGILNIFGAGNDGEDTDRDQFDPASFRSPSVVSVASSNSSDRRSIFSNYGGDSVDLAAPGERILSTHKSTYAYESGTSMAAAHVAGAVAFLSGLDPSLSPDGLKSVLLANVDRLPQWSRKVVSGGRLNLRRAAEAIGVRDNRPPEVSILNPIASATFEPGQPIAIEAAANDPDGRIEQVVFYADGAAIGTVTASPFVVSWTPAAPGRYTLTAVATDDRDATTRSSGVAVTVSAPNTPPSVALTAPASGATFVSPATLTLSANASDTDGTITSVTFLANGQTVGVDTTSPYSVSWGPVGPGSYTLVAIAIDDRQGATTSSNVFINVVAPNVAPTVSLTGPANGASFLAPANIALSATAADPDGSVAAVTFLVDGSPIGVTATSPFTFAWNNVPAGTYALSAMATDNRGATTISSAFIVMVIVPVRMNVAASANGGVASASSMFTNNYPTSGAINGDRRGLNWGTSGGWNDGTANAYPDWLVVDFNGAKTIDEVDVFSLQDSYTSPVEPTPTMTFTLWGLRTFEIQYWTGSTWDTIPGATIVNNTLVWRRFTFAPVTTTRIRLFITAALNGSSRVIELEAWGIASFAPRTRRATSA